MKIVYRDFDEVCQHLMYLFDFVIGIRLEILKQYKYSSTFTPCQLLINKKCAIADSLILRPHHACCSPDNLSLFCGFSNSVFKGKVSDDDSGNNRAYCI